MVNYYNPESRPLTMTEMTVNANFILSYLTGKGWSKNAVCGLLGNLQSESSINPSRWQDDNVGDTADGFGLTQWTPATKYLDWVSGTGWDYKSMEGNLERILYEVEHNMQWFGGVSGSLTFKEWTQSTDTPYNLAMDFIATYEHPADPTQSIRGTQAEYWFSHLEGNGSIGGYQLALFPMDVINISQGENGSYSHRGTLCIDFLGKTDQYPYYAPCDCECIQKNTENAYLIWKSSSPVMCADGVVRSIVWSAFHDCSPPHDIGTKLKKGELMGHTGICGNVTGDHVHFNIIEGSTYNGFAFKPDPCLAGTELHIYDIFAVNGVEVQNGLNYAWKTSDYIDGSSGGSGNNPQADKRKIYHLWLAGALQGGV